MGVLKGHSNYDEVIVEDLIVIEKYRGIKENPRLSKYFFVKYF